MSNKMTKVAKVFSLFYATNNGASPALELEFDTKGILNDKHYNKDIDRSVLITSLESYALVEENGIDIPYGALGENLLIDYNPYALEVGTRLKISEVILEISKHCTLCKSFTKIDTKLPKLLKNDRGIFAKVIQAGSIHAGDAMYILD